MPYEKHRNEHGLTPRQMEAMGYVARGYTRPEIAQLMGVSIDTVKQTLRHSYATLDLANVQHAVVWWVRNVGWPEEKVPVKDVLAKRARRPRRVA